MRVQRLLLSYLSLYLCCVVLLIAVWAPTLSEYWRLSAEDMRLYEESLPYEPAEEIEARFERLLERITDSSGNSLEEYFAILAEVRHTELLVRKFDVVHHYESPSLATQFLFRVRGVSNALAVRQPEFFDTATREEIDLARERYMPEDSLLRKSFVSYGTVWKGVRGSYLASIPIFLVFFAIRLHRRRFRLVLEPHRLLAAAFAWPVGVLVYPTKLSEERQFREAVAFVTYVIAAFLSLGGAGMANAQTKKGSEKKQQAGAELIEEQDKEFVWISDPNPPQLTPVLHFGDTSLSLYGWSSASYREGREQAFGLSSVRLRGTVSTETPFSGFVDVDVSSALLDGSLEGNWLKEVWVAFRLSDDWHLRAGRLFLPAGYSTPPPFLLDTAEYFRWPFGLNGTGVQMNGKIGENWNLAVAVTGSSSTAWSDGGQFDQPEFSGNFSWTHSSSLKVGATVQVSSTFRRYAIDGLWSTGRHKLRGAFHWTEDGTGWYVFYGLRPTDWLQLQSQLDHEWGEEPSSLIWTNGIRVNTPEDNLAFVLNYNFSKVTCS